METEKCQFCGASVKKENLKGHYERVHAKHAGSLAQPRTIATSNSIFRSHRKRNIGILALLVLGTIGVSVAASQFSAGNTMRMHWHPELSVMINGGPVTVPSEIGIDSTLWVDHSLDQYGIGMAPLHTHNTSGQIHEESNTVRDFTLQEFLAIWGQHLDSGRVLGHPVDTGHRAYIVINGVEKSGALDLVFAEGQKIQIVCGP